MKVIYDSYMNGTFEGWDGYAIYELENGQVGNVNFLLCTWVFNRRMNTRTALHGGAGMIGWFAMRCLVYWHRPIARNHARRGSIYD